MWDRILHRVDLHRVIDELCRSRRVVGPVRRDGRDLYEPVENAASLDLGFSYCVYGPKSYLFPPRKTLFTYNFVNGQFEARPVFDERPLAIVGVHPCDLHALRLLDHVFGAAPADEHYLARRRQTMLVGVDCVRPCADGTFCRDMGTHSAIDGFDLMCDPLSYSTVRDRQEYGVTFGSAAGRELVLRMSAGRVANGADGEAFATYQASKQIAFPAVLSETAETLPALLDKSYDSLLWEATARRCYSCGSCNLVCPTCYCFDLHDEPDLGSSSGHRVREWDGCQLHGFADVAGGHNFRSKAASRLRHRVYRKGKWIREQNGMAGCVGCGRCDRACTAKISLVDLFSQLAEEA